MSSEKAWIKLKNLLTPAGHDYRKIRVGSICLNRLTVIERTIPLLCTYSLAVLALNAPTFLQVVCSCIYQLNSAPISIFEVK